MYVCAKPGNPHHFKLNETPENSTANILFVTYSKIKITIKKNSKHQYDEDILFSGQKIVQFLITK